MKYLLNLNFFISTLILSVIIIIVFIILLKSVRRKIPHHRLKENHDVAGFIYNAVCFIYSVLIAFVVYVVWNEYKETNSIVEQEVLRLTDLLSETVNYPDSNKKEIQSMILNYTNLIINKEWDSMYSEKEDKDTRDAFLKLKNYFYNINNTDYQNKYIDESIKKINELSDLRRLRIIKAKENIPDILWITIILFSIVLILFTYFFGANNIKHQYIMTSLLIFICVIIVYLIFVLDSQFYGYHKISTDVYNNLIQHVNN